VHVQDNYGIGELCEYANRQYAKRHGYGFVSEVLPYDEMLAAVQPRTHCTW
jgi:hypothetical protein